MDSNTPEKKPKRPRIGQPIQAAGESHDSSYERPYTPRHPAPKAATTAARRAATSVPLSAAPLQQPGRLPAAAAPYGPQGYDQRPIISAARQLCAHRRRPCRRRRREALRARTRAISRAPSAPTTTREAISASSAHSNNQAVTSPASSAHTTTRADNRAVTSASSALQQPGGQQGGYQRPQRPYNNQGGQQGGYQRPQRPYNNQGEASRAAYQRQQRPLRRSGQQGGYQQRPGQRPYNKNNRQQGPGNFPAPPARASPAPQACGIRGADTRPQRADTSEQIHEQRRHMPPRGRRIHPAGPGEGQRPGCDRARHQDKATPTWLNTTKR